ncbi:hypothetical protein FRB90_002379 [Tulasnella sp. 427]|nr:hypothetical protein FRB90_002379 [Tulasnella sp. 427]
MWKEKGNELFKLGLYGESRQAYMNAMRLLLLQPRAYNPIMTKGSDPIFHNLGKEDRLADFLDATACANNIAQSYIKERDHALSLEWLLEVHRMYEAYLIGKNTEHYKWKSLNFEVEEFVTTRMKAFLRQASVLQELGNSAGVAAAACDAFIVCNRLGNIRNEPIQRLQKECRIEDRLTKRHPDPDDILNIRYLDPKLQTRGVWNKLQVGKGSNGNPPSRKDFASIVWKGTYYIFGGLHGTSKSHDDGWAINLRDLRRGWRRVPHPEIDFRYSRDSRRFAVYGDKAYLFIGQPGVLVLDLKTETWSTIRTTARRGLSWAQVFPGNKYDAYACAIHGTTIYYFGGNDADSRIGRNALVTLDLKTMQWDLLCGKVELNDDPKYPGVREHPVLWIAQEKIWVTLGNANRQAEWLRSGTDNHGAADDHTYQDLWSFDLKAKVWTDERFSGNYPCMRTEVACTFNKTWNRAVIHGGYCASLVFGGSTSSASEGTGFTYFGDTFAWNPETNSWSQVITRGFPTYRAAADLFTDEETGRTYLFGGYTNTSYTPSSRNAPAQRFRLRSGSKIHQIGPLEDLFYMWKCWKMDDLRGSVQEHGPSRGVLWGRMPKARVEGS